MISLLILTTTNISQMTRNAMGHKPYGIVVRTLRLCIALTMLAMTALSGPVASKSVAVSDPQDNILTIFTPYDDGFAAYSAFLDRAQKSVYVAGYALADKSIIDKLIDLKTQHGVSVHILMDFSQTQGRSAKSQSLLIAALRQAGIEVIAGSSEKSHQLMHDKYTIVDDEWVESGSWNYTRAANKQDNVLDIIRSPKRAKLFRANWDRMYPVMKAQQSQRDEQAFWNIVFLVLSAGSACVIILLGGLIYRRIVLRKREKAIS